MSSLQLPFAVQMTNPGNVDYYYGPYANVAAANAAVPSALRLNKTVGILVAGTLVEYIWNNGTTENDLVLKVNYPTVVDKVGNLATLSTLNKSAAVPAINEVNSNIGNLVALLTNAKGNTVEAINELKALISNLSQAATGGYSSTDFQFITNNVTTQPYYGPGTTDKTRILNAANLLGAAGTNIHVYNDVLHNGGQLVDIQAVGQIGGYTVLPNASIMLDRIGAMHFNIVLQTNVPVGTTLAALLIRNTGVALDIVEVLTAITDNDQIATFSNFGYQNGDILVITDSAMVTVAGGNTLNYTGVTFVGSGNLQKDVAIEIRNSSNQLIVGYSFTMPTGTKNFDFTDNALADLLANNQLIVVSSQGSRKIVEHVDMYKVNAANANRSTINKPEIINANGVYVYISGLLIDDGALLTTGRYFTKNLTTGDIELPPLAANEIVLIQKF